MLIAASLKCLTSHADVHNTILLVYALDPKIDKAAFIPLLRKLEPDSAVRDEDFTNLDKVVLAYCREKVGLIHDAPNAQHHRRREALSAACCC